MNFDMDSLMGYVNTIKEKGMEYAGLAVDKTKDAAKLAKLKMDQMKEAEAVKKAYVELGKIWYEENHEGASGIYASLCEEIDAAKKRSDDLLAEIDELKSSLGMVFENAAEADFESVVSESEEE